MKNYEDAKAQVVREKVLSQRSVLVYLLLWITILFLGVEYAGAQTPCCPDFKFKDALNICDESCQGEPHGDQPGGGRAMIGCKNSPHTYTVYPMLSGYTYNWIITGGTPASYTGNPLVVVWGSGTSGSIKVVVSNSDSTCVDSIFRDICLTDGPIASFTYAPSSPCANTPIVFTNNSTGAASYLWDFGDGSTSNLTNPSHAYSSPGTYTVLLTAIGAASAAGMERCDYCTDTVSQQITISSIPGPPIEPDTCFSTVCPGETTSFCTPVTGCAYNWSVNGGTIVNGTGTNCIEVVWNMPSTFPTYVSLAVSGGGCGYCSNPTLLNVPVLYPSLPISGPNIVCQGASASFSLPSLPGTYYSWAVSGSGGNTFSGPDSNASNVTITFNDPIGSYTVTCNYSNPLAGCSGSSTITVDIKPRFTMFGPTLVCQGSSMPFNANGNANWTVTPSGPSVSGSGSSVSITWLSPGAYTVTAVPTVPANFCNNIATVNVNVIEIPVLNSIVGQDTVCPGKDYNYSISSNTTGSPFTWTANNGTIISTMGGDQDSAAVQWDPTGPHQLIVYQQVSVPGITCQSLPETLDVYLYSPPIITGPTSACVDEEFGYIVSNVSMPTGSYQWEILPGNLGTITNNGQGTDSVVVQWHGLIGQSTVTAQLAVTTCTGSDTISITVKTPPAVTITSSGNLCTGITLSTSATGSSYLWSTGATTSSVTGITLPGIYSVTVTNVNGTNCTVSGYYIIPDVGRPVAKASADNSLVYCLPNVPPSMNIVAASGSGYSYQWYMNGSPVSGATSAVLPINNPGFPATNNINTAGTYTFFVIVTLNSCVDTSNVITITIQPSCPGGGGCTGEFEIQNITGCNPFTFTLNPISPPGATIIPGSITINNNSGNTTVTYDSVGYKQVKICATLAIPGGDSCHVCKDTVVLVKVAPDFLANENCGTVTLTDLSTAVPPTSISSYSWSVSPGAGTSFNSTSIASPVLTIINTGVYIISQTVTAGGCAVTALDTVVVTLPNATFTYPDTLCAGTPGQFTAMAGFLQYEWDFGDLSNSFINDPQHSYENTGNYNVTLVVMDSMGCLDSVTETITVIPQQTCSITAAPDTMICPGDTVSFTACSGMQTYQWFKNGNVIPGVTTNTYSTSQHGEYWVVATSYSGGCITESNHKNVIVKPIPMVNLMGTKNICTIAGNPANFNFMTAYQPYYSYSWSGPFPAVSGAVLNSTTDYYLTGTLPANTTGTYYFVVEVSHDSSGCKVSDTICAIFNEGPSLTISASATNACEGTPVTFTANPMPSGTYNYLWSNGETTSSITVSSPGMYSLTITDPATGCDAWAYGGMINPKPDLSLFPLGCDTLCDTAHIYVPLALSDGMSMSNYTISWYDNGDYSSPIGTSETLSVSSLSGDHHISVIVTNFYGCTDTSSLYHIYVKSCNCSCEEGEWGTTTVKGEKGDLGGSTGEPGDLGTGQGSGQGDDQGDLDASTSTQQGGGMRTTATTGQGQQGGQQQGKKLKCNQDKAYKLPCNQTYTVNTSYKCYPEECSEVIQTMLFPNNSTNSSTSGSLSFTTNQNGLYTLTQYGLCGSDTCDTCVFKFEVKCSLEAQECCQNDSIKVELEGNISSTIVDSEIVAGINPVIYAGNAPIQELRISIVDFKYKGFSNSDCQKCWTQDDRAGIFDKPSISIPATSGSFSHLNAPDEGEREIIFSGSADFSSGLPFGLNIILPRTLDIECCSGKVEVCLKFTLKDSKCQTCTITECYTVGIN